VFTLERSRGRIYGGAVDPSSARRLTTRLETSCARHVWCCEPAGRCSVSLIWMYDRAPVAGGSPPVFDIGVVGPHGVPGGMLGVSGTTTPVVVSETTAGARRGVRLIRREASGSYWRKRANLKCNLIDSRSENAKSPRGFPRSRKVLEIRPR